MSDTNGQNNNSNFFNPSSNRRHSDSRLSLAELTSFLKLGDDLKETATREKNILTVLKDELGFELGLKTWIRDTSLAKRVQLIENLTEIVENRYHYGYDKKIIEVIVRRASYYTMQGRLRRERRIEQKGKMNLSLVNKVRKNKK
ncbi:hypothetical protein PACTADRAFT_33366 [Pachysolen tannophilus NRRL Y-2460]|uniref:Uncharacterized protein n=1 Tax=Pachysolen tannophilus NRRL Y-2460 TaxID=669874 RepID=A0A1E4TWT3_PACTA|nr:hypothetical protein PACTADRAFT_33366 [Pachysolen tannophilus NRRL Y-2460]